MGGGGKKKQRAPTPTPLPTFEEERSPTSKNIRDAESLKLRRKRGTRGNIITSPLGVQNGVTGMANVLGVKK
jgi:hypothetical protein